MPTTHYPPTRPERLLAVDLRHLPEEKMSRLRKEATKRGIALIDLLAELIDESAERMLAARRQQIPSPARDERGVA